MRLASLFPKRSDCWPCRTTIPFTNYILAVDTTPSGCILCFFVSNHVFSFPWLVTIASTGDQSWPYQIIPSESATTAFFLSLYLYEIISSLFPSPHIESISQFLACRIQFFFFFYKFAAESVLSMTSLVIEARSHSSPQPDVQRPSPFLLSRFRVILRYMKSPLLLRLFFPFRTSLDISTYDTRQEIKLGTAHCLLVTNIWRASRHKILLLSSATNLIQIL
ncbi:hypothetical protein K469DRAFT_133969 [Zopfia rhizophila CBS 207.26]|uniref:Uncharacterized protein n=1 Tax=Zopfia rhizophila CBS 207.26 TaxID=1314779 RepID=A0A6A6ERK6_9PEZI|nr:hypothetical protein K469DRAFT_133969 [Zopfia rhizophila CBS 207.26]